MVHPVDLMYVVICAHSSLYKIYQPWISLKKSWNSEMGFPAAHLTWRPSPWNSLCMGYLGDVGDEEDGSFGQLWFGLGLLCVVSPLFSLLGGADTLVFRGWSWFGFEASDNLDVWSLGGALVDFNSGSMVVQVESRNDRVTSLLSDTQRT